MTLAPTPTRMPGNFRSTTTARFPALLLAALLPALTGHAQGVTVGANPIGAGSSDGDRRTEPLDLKGPDESTMAPNWPRSDQVYEQFPTRYFPEGPEKSILRPSRRFFLPVNAPMLADVSPVEKLGDGYPAGLIDHLGEPYYTAYGSLLVRKLVSPKRAQRLVLYRGEKQQLLTELRTQLDTLTTLPARAWAAPLAELSARQTPRLRELEREAEAIREDLTTTGLFKDIEDGSGLGTPGREFTDPKDALLSQYLLLVSAGQIQNGLSPEQRQLLAEMATQQWFEANRDESAPSTDGQLFFLPATSRIRLPAGLSPGLLAQIQVFREEKDRLKAELRAAVIREQNYIFVTQRTQAFAQLAARQAPRFASLETLAEEIRNGLAAYPYPDEPVRSDLSAELTRRVGTAISQKAELQRKLSRRLRELRAELPADRVEVIREEDSLALTVAPGDKATAAQRKARDKALAALPAFNEEMRHGYTTLAADMATLRQDIQRYTEGHPQDASSGVAQLVREFNQSYATQETWNRYRDYYRAVLQPGLSPEQRRLLYQGALAELRQSAPTTP